MIMAIPTRSFFGVQENLLKLSELDTIYVDGTFSTSSSLFCQLFTIEQFPPVYGFLLIPKVE